MERIPVLLINVCSLVFILAALVFGIQNLAQTASFSLLTLTLPNLSVGVALLVTGALMAAGFSIKLLGLLLQQKQAGKKALRSAEKLGVSAEASGEKVKALEQKIQTLEKALATALSKATL